MMNSDENDNESCGSVKGGRIYGLAEQLSPVQKGPLLQGGSDYNALNDDLAYEVFL
jgi:hypothetical protein